MTFEQVQQKVAEMVNTHNVWMKFGATFIPDDPPPAPTVVWSGGELLPDRESVEDDRLRYVPSYALDDGEAAPPTVRRKYTLTGKHKRLPSTTETPNERDTCV